MRITKVLSVFSVAMLVGARGALAQDDALYSLETWVCTADLIALGAVVEADTSTGGVVGHKQLYTVVTLAADSYLGEAIGPGYRLVSPCRQYGGNHGG